MKKSIGAKIVGLMSVLLVVFLITIGCVWVKVSDMNAVSNRLGNTYLTLEKDLGTITTMVQSQMKRCLLMNSCSRDEPEMVEQVGSASIDECAKIEAAVAEMTPLVEELNVAEISEQYAVIAENCAIITEHMPLIYEAYIQGDNETASALEEESLQGQTIQIEMANEVLQEILTEAMGQEQAQMKKQENELSLIMVILLVLFLLVYAAILLALHVIIKPAKRASAQLEEMIEDISKNEGDLTARLLVSTEDEIGQLISGINRFIEQLQVIVKKIHTESGSLRVSVEEINSGIRNSNENTASVSAVTEELSASMEEVSGTLAQISDDTEEIVETAEEMNRQAQEGYSFVKEIQNRATEVKEFSISSKENAGIMMEERQKGLERAIINSQSVGKINELTEEILSLTSQTNLLALNASIEAARAGETGRGFAVVADEIRVLADSSRETANNIQEISGIVNKAVEELSFNANEILHFISSTVIADYDRFVEVAGQYYKDAENMDEIIGVFHKNSEELKNILKNVANGIHDINATVDESTRGISTAAENASVLASAMADIEKEADNNSRISNDLMAEVARFKEM